MSRPPTRTAAEETGARVLPGPAGFDDSQVVIAFAGNGGGGVNQQAVALRGGFHRVGVGCDDRGLAGEPDARGERLDRVVVPPT